MIKIIVTVILVAMLQYRLGVVACCNQTLVPTTLTQLNCNEWWGPYESNCDESVNPFQVNFSEKMIENLKVLLNNYRELVPPLEGVNFEYGFNSKQIYTWAKYWSEEYNFQERETFFNQFPQYKTCIQGLNIHFIRVKPQVPDGITVLPLLLLHGWPSSVLDYYEAIPLLTKVTEGYNFVFEVIVPSLPGHGFSDSAVRPGLGAAQAAVIYKNLMNRLGFKRFYIQGGDWGALIASMMSTMYHHEVLGYHSNNLNILKYFITPFIPQIVMDYKLANVFYPQSKDDFTYSDFVEETGYFHLQATKPDTIGIALSTSPVGLLAYILEKFSTWTRKQYRSLPDGGLFNDFTKEQLIDGIMMYWITNSITTSMRFYAETMTLKNQGLGIDEYPTSVPVWAIKAKHDFVQEPNSLLQMKFCNLLGVTNLDDGGHFLALQLPQIFSDDVFKAMQAFRDFHDTTDTDLEL